MDASLTKLLILLKPPGEKFLETTRGHGNIIPPFQGQPPGQTVQPILKKLVFLKQSQIQPI